MKHLIKSFLVFAFMLGCINLAHGQNTKKERQASKAAAIKKMVDDVNYVFEANTAIPLRGGSRQLTSPYDLKVSKDTIVAWLPYFGRAYVAPVNPSEGGIKFTWTKFDYKVKQAKNGNWKITIKPKEKNIGDMRDVQRLSLDISSSGYASLQVISSNRDPISFYGDIVEVKAKK